MRIREAVLQISGRIAKYATLAKSTGKGFDAIDGAAAGEDEPKPQEPARRMAWYAFRSVPPVGSECAVIAGRAGSTNKMIVGADHRGFGKTDMSEGEAQIFTRFGQSVFLDKDGAITSTAAGSTVKQDKDGNIVLTSKGGAVLTMDDSEKLTTIEDNLTVSRDTKSGHFAGGGSTPTGVAGTALGTNGAVSLSGTDTGCLVTMTSGAMATMPGTMATITFARAFASTPRAVALTAADSESAGATLGGKLYVEASTTELKIGTTGTPDTNKTYKVHFIAIQ